MLGLVVIAVRWPSFDICIISNSESRQRCSGLTKKAF